MGETLSPPDTAKLLSNHKISGHERCQSAIQPPNHALEMARISPRFVPAIGPPTILKAYRRPDLEADTSAGLIVKLNNAGHRNRHGDAEGYVFIGFRSPVWFALNGNLESAIGSNNWGALTLPAARKNGPATTLICIRLSFRYVRSETASIVRDH